MDNQKDKVAIVILNWNGQKFLEQFMPSVDENSKGENYTVYVADNGSTDNSIQFLKEKYPNVKLIIFDKNYGFTGGYNKALEQINAEYFILLNSDIEVTPNWITPIISFMDKNPEVAAVQPKILAYYDKKQFEYAGAAGGFIDKFGYPFCRGRIIDTAEKDNNQYNEITEIFWATGACLFIRSEEYLKNKLDDDFFAHMEEIDLCWRLKNQGKKIVYFPDVQVYHVGGGTLPKTSPKKLFLNYRNNLLLLYKNLPKEKLFKTLISRMLLDGISAFVYLLKFQFSSFNAVFKAHLQFYKLKPKFKQKRKDLLKYNSVDFEEIYNKSIVFNYILRKKNTFTSLNYYKNKKYDR